MIPASILKALPPLRRLRTVAGGDICRAFAAETEDGSKKFFIKCLNPAEPTMFPAEARGLERINAACGGLCPQTVAATPDGLVLEWLDLKPGPVGAAAGRAMATLHRVPQAGYGGTEANFLGTLPQSQTPRATWAEFYGHERLLPMAQRCPAPLRRAVEGLLPRLGDLLDLPDPPSLIHGDLWGGNIGETSGGQARVFDPAVSHGHREQDLAMTLLFGGFSPAFYAAYEATYPITPGWRERVELHQLYPLLAHAVLFGGSYVAAAQRIAERY